MWNYPANSTIARLKAKGFQRMIWGNGDFLML